MESFKTYKVTCLNCQGSNKVKIIEHARDQYQIDFTEDHQAHPLAISIISGRYRTDMQFGWQCLCGNTSILAREEFPNIRQLVAQGGEAAIKRLTQSLKTDDDKKFTMVEL